MWVWTATLPAPVNSAYNDYDAFMVADGSGLLFASDRPDGHNPGQRNMTGTTKLSDALLLPLAAMNAASADNFFTMGVNDTVAIAAADRGHSVTLPVNAHFDGRVNRWTLTLSYPDGLAAVMAIGGEGMAVPYLNSEGEECIHNAVLTTDQSLTTISSMVTVPGYWPYGSGYLAYGFATWESGDYDGIFSLTVDVDRGFQGGNLSISGTLAGVDPWGGGVGNGVLFYRNVVFIVTFERGDVNGDGEVNIGDVTALINFLLTDTQPDTDGQFNAADVDGSGHLSIADVTDLINLLLTH